MSTSIANSRPADSSAEDDQISSDPSRGELSELVDRYAVAEFLPPVEWVTRLSLIEPRNNLRCLGRWTRFKKRTLDVCVAFVALILLTPVMLLTALLVKLTSPGTMVFRQERVGLNLRGQKKNDRRKTSAEPPEGIERRAGNDRRNDDNYGKPFVLYKFRLIR